MAGVAVTLRVEGAPQGGTKTVKLSSPASVSALASAIANGGFSGTTAVGGMNDGDPGGESVWISVYNLVMAINT